MAELHNQPVVIDNGTGVIKAGFAGDDTPKILFPNYVGRPKYQKCMVGELTEQSEFVGSRAQHLRGLLKLEHPMKHGVVSNWVAMENVWNYTFSSLAINSEDHPVLITESPLNPTKNREKTAEIFFETFNVPAFFVSMQAVLSLYASGSATGVVLDCGDGVSTAVPIFEGFALNHAIQRIDLAGRDVTDHLQLLLRKSGHNFTTSSTKEIVANIKEKQCYVSYDPSKEEDNIENQTPSLYTMPDGSVIEIGSERYKAPEILFNPAIIGEEVPGVHELLIYSIEKTDVDLRSVLFDNIVLAGGTTILEGFPQRLLREMKSYRKSFTPQETKIRISSPPNRQYCSWTGGSILASLGPFPSMWVSHQDYEEYGSWALQRNSFLNNF
eukprot:TRINITY_DN7850_c0_g1_i1.p1 TRINITY_DN7850_c0_g1~~TRINITY_DN7850_c0_g1_i1.p1  ORF type:complete len:395 (-),score=77.58 TRINITY_DN7850_c0_g1_i1:77-1225(-)